MVETSKSKSSEGYGLVTGRNYSTEKINFFNKNIGKSGKNKKRKIANLIIGT